MLSRSLATTPTIGRLTASCSVKSRRNRNARICCLGTRGPRRWRNAGTPSFCLRKKTALSPHPSLSAISRSGPVPSSASSHGFHLRTLCAGLGRVPAMPNSLRRLNTSCRFTPRRSASFRSGSEPRSTSHSGFQRGTRRGRVLRRLRFAARRLARRLAFTSRARYSGFFNALRQMETVRTRTPHQSATAGRLSRWTARSNPPQTMRLGTRFPTKVTGQGIRPEEKPTTLTLPRTAHVRTSPTRHRGG
jgi:hypothetical protein